MHLQDEKSSAIATLNRLLRGELAAVQTYALALEKVGEEPGAPALRAAMREHVEAVDALRDSIRSLGGEPTAGAGAWGVWTRFVGSASRLLGDNAAVKALREGEVLGLKDYEDALAEPTLDPSSRALIGERLMPRLQRHIRELERFIDGSGYLSPI